MKERIKEFTCVWIPILSAFLMVLVFVGIHAFIYQHSYKGYDNAWIFLVPVLGVMAVTLFLFHHCKNRLERLADVEISYLLVGVVFAVSVFLILMAAEGSTGVISVSDSRVLDLALFKIEKKWLFDLYVILVFPTFVTFIKNGLTRNDTIKNRAAAVAAIALLNAASVLFFLQMPAIYLVEMAVLNFFTVVSALFFWDLEKVMVMDALDYDDDEDSSVWDEDEDDLDWIGGMFFYFAFWIFLLLSTKPLNESFTEYMYSGNWNLYKQNISALVECTGTWGAAYGPENMYTIRQFLAENNNVIHSLLYYSGWGGMVIYGSLLVGFVALMFRFLGGRYFFDKPYYLIYQAAFFNLLIRAVCGILYGYGILPIPVSLPFGGSVALLMDGVCVALMLYSEIFENIPVRQAEKRDGVDEWEDEFDGEEDWLWKKDGEEL